MTDYTQEMAQKKYSVWWHQNVITEVFLDYKNHVCFFAGIVVPERKDLFYIAQIVACTCFGVNFDKNNVGSHILFEISLRCVMLNVSGRAMLPDPTVPIFITQFLANRLLFEKNKQTTTKQQQNDIKIKKDREDFLYLCSTLK